MKRALLCLPLLALASLSMAQSTRLSLSDAIDLRGKLTPVVAYKLKTYSVTGFLGRTDNAFDFDVDAFASQAGDVRLGLGITHTWTRTLRIANEFQPVVGLTLGAWTNYGTGVGKLSGGPYVGLTVKF